MEQGTSFSLNSKLWESMSDDRTSKKKAVLLEEIVTDLVDKLKAVGDDSYQRKEKIKQRHIVWSKHYKSSFLSAKEFEKMFTIARQRAASAMESPETFQSLYKREPKNRVDLSEMLEEFDSIERGTATAMVDHLNDQIRRLDDLKESTVVDCAKEARKEMKRKFEKNYSAPTFKKLWQDAKLVVWEMHGLSFGNLKKKNTDIATKESLETRKTADPDSPSVAVASPASYEEEFSRPTKKQRSAATSDSNSTPQENEFEDTDDEAERRGKSAGCDDTRPRLSAAKMKHATLEKYYQTIKASITELMWSARHRPLQALLGEQKKIWRDKLMEAKVLNHDDEENEKDAIKLRFERLWKRVKEFIEKEWKSILMVQGPASNMDWSFLVSGKTYDYQKTKEYLNMDDRCEDLLVEPPTDV